VTDDRAHWENTYAERTPEKVSWYETRPQRSLELNAAGFPSSATATKGYSRFSARTSSSSHRVSPPTTLLGRIQSTAVTILADVHIQVRFRPRRERVSDSLPRCSGVGAQPSCHYDS
jgi:hypothetical protein